MFLGFVSADVIQANTTWASTVIVMLSNITLKLESTIVGKHFNAKTTDNNFSVGRERDLHGIIIYLENIRFDVPPVTAYAEIP